MTKRTVIVDVDRSPEQTFRIKRGEYVTVAIVARFPKQKEASIKVRLTGKGAKATILGIIIGKDDTQFSLHTLQLHEAPETTSNLLVKSVLSGKTQFHYDGAIRVERRAQKTDAYQRNENLLLSSSAHAESKPTLEILANDVRCTHGATIGTIPADELWYLATRGINQIQATKLIVAGFWEDILRRIEDNEVRLRVSQSLREQLYQHSRKPPRQTRGMN